MEKTIEKMFLKALNKKFSNKMYNWYNEKTQIEYSTSEEIYNSNDLQEWLLYGRQLSDFVGSLYSGWMEDIAGGYRNENGFYQELIVMVDESVRWYFNETMKAVMIGG